MNKTKQIILSYCKSSGFSEIFSAVNQITIHDTSFAGGGFGDIYHISAIDGNVIPPIPQVVKVFKESTDGRNEHSWKTISRLQDCIVKEVELLRTNNLDFLSEYPAFWGLPQFSFVGTLDGKEVRGYVSNNLNAMGYYSFDKIREDSRLGYEFYANRDIRDKFIMCYHLARAFRFLMKNNYIHADLSADNIFISGIEPLCALIDFDSGAIVEQANDNPSTWGKPQDWLAPEISFNFVNPKEIINVNLFTDAWSVAIAIHYILLSVPAYFLTDLSRNTLHYYTKKYTWPEIEESDEKFNVDLTDVYKNFLLDAKYLPEPIFREFQCTFTNGVFDPTLRTTYYKWELVLRELIPPEKRKATRSKLLKPIEPLPPPPPTMGEIKKYINELIRDIILEGEDLKKHRGILCEIAARSGLDGNVVLTEMNEFIYLFNEVIEDRVVTKLEKSNLFMQAELSYISRETVDELISTYQVM